MDSSATRPTLSASMRAPRRTLPALLALAGVVAGGCGSGKVNPPGPGKVARPERPSAYRPSAPVIGCLRAARVPVRDAGPGQFGIGSPASGMRLVFAETVPSAQLAQLRGQAEGAEVVNRVLFYVGRARDAEIKTVEACLDANTSQSG
jgi:hypothetical protein